MHIVTCARSYVVGLGYVGLQGHDWLKICGHNEVARLIFSVTMRKIALCIFRALYKRLSLAAQLVYS